MSVRLTPRRAYSRSCEDQVSRHQSHSLAEEGDRLPYVEDHVRRLTVLRLLSKGRHRGVSTQLTCIVLPFNLVQIFNFWGSEMTLVLTIPGPYGAHPSNPLPSDH